MFIWHTLKGCMVQHKLLGDLGQQSYDCYMFSSFVWLSIDIFEHAKGYTHLRYLQVEFVCPRWFPGKGHSCFFPSAIWDIKKKGWLHGRHCVICCSLFTVRFVDGRISFEVFCFVFSTALIGFWDRQVSYGIQVKATKFKVLSSLWGFSYLWPLSH